MKTSSTFSLRLAAAGFALAALAGCPQVPPADPLEPPPAVRSFTASKSEVGTGESVTLAWSVENATDVKIDELKLGSISGVSGSSGEVEVAITEPALFVLTARNARGASATAVVAVRVSAVANAELLFAALPGSVQAGEPVTLGWSALGVSSVTLTADPGGPVDLAGQGASGTVIVQPVVTTTYTLSGGGRTATAVVTVTPTLRSFTASPLAAALGSTVTLSWQTAGASRVRLSVPGRGDLVDTTDAARVAAGSFDDVIPANAEAAQLFPYQLTVSGAGVTLTDSLVVTIAGRPTVLTFTAPKYVAQGSDAGVTLRWTTRETDAVVISAGGVEIYRAPPEAIASGTAVVPTPAADVTYAVTATNARGGTSTATAAVDVVGPPSVTLTATPTGFDFGEATTLRWAGTDVRNVRISSALDGTLFTANDVGDTGTATGLFAFPRSVEVRIDVDNGAGQTAFATTLVSVDGGVAFSVPAGSVLAGEPTTVSWSPATLTLTGLPHADVVVRNPSTGWEDISTTGTVAVLADADNVSRVLADGFTAPFFGRVVGPEVWIDADGFISFTPMGAENYSSVTLPSSKLEPYSIAPCWTDLSSTSNVRWQVKDVATGGRVLIVQWSTSYQLKLYSSGQLDIEYNSSSTCTNRGVRGPYGDDGFRFTTTTAVGLGLTLFGPKTGSANLVYRHEQPLAATQEVDGRTYLLTGPRFPVVQANELSIGEALVSPLATVGRPGQWFELSNTSSDPVDLTGWLLRGTDGGMIAPLAGVVPARGVLVAGASVDPALNDDAGVTLELPNFFPGLDAGAVQFFRDGGLPAFAWTNATPGTAVVSDYGPYRFSTDDGGIAARPQTCLATEPFGSQAVPQLGTPGTPGHCGFPYTWQEVPAGFFDISSTGMALTFDNLDDATTSVSLAAAPFPYFGTPRTSMSIGTNGFVAFDGTLTDSQFPTNYPSTTDVNAALAIFGGDLEGFLPNAKVVLERVGANVDPAASAPHWIVQWSHFAHWDTRNASSGFRDDLNFQVKLFDDGTVEYHFGEMRSGSSLRLGTGLRAVTWLENPAGTQALILNARSYTPGISSNTAFRFSPR